VKNLAKLAIFFSLTFVIIFAVSAGVRFLELRVDWAKNLPPKPETSLTLFIAAANWALSLTLFSSIIVSLNYAIRRNYSAFMTIICVMSLSFILCFGITSALEHGKTVPPAQTMGIPLGAKGLILSNSLSRSEASVILLSGSLEPLGPRVVAISGQPLIFQETANANFDLPPVPFVDETPWFLKSLSIDVRLNAETLLQKFREGFFSYFIYAGSLIFLLCSLGYAVKFSVWPLANLFIAALVFRGILMLETFFNTPEMQEITRSFLDNKLPVPLALPLLFFAFGVLVYLYSFLVFAVKRRDDDD
jgi:hypothetical protein